ncbi:hypothetical protein IW248_003302 [Micromonospora ureilytica]|uniref:Uncharacterized protein n=1 Tax=Micromonospora ureilytica TaxID=709868 RepID=A0ABS0JIY2_9ACTN|nr:hypothetical protein [Micromonospora ureilytica]
MQLSKSLSTRLAAIAVAITAAFGLTVASAPAASAAPAASFEAQSCQSESRALHYYYWNSARTEILDWSRLCSGGYNLNSKGYGLSTGSWSGVVKFADGGILPFCPWQDRPFSSSWPNVIRIEISASHASHCP